MNGTNHFANYRPRVETILTRRMPATLVSLPTLRHAARDALLQAGVRRSVFDESISVALTEAVGNVVRHAYPDADGDIEVAVVHDDLGILVVVSDTGVGIDHPPAHPGLGLGLGLIERLSTESAVDSTAEGTTVTMRFSLPVF